MLRRLELCRPVNIELTNMQRNMDRAATAIMLVLLVTQNIGELLSVCSLTATVAKRKCHGITVHISVGVLGHGMNLLGFFCCLCK